MAKERRYYNPITKLIAKIVETNYQKDTVIYSYRHIDSMEWYLTISNYNAFIKEFYRAVEVEE